MPSPTLCEKKGAKDGPPAVISSAVKLGVGGEASALRLPHVDDDGFGEAVLGAHAILAPEVLQKSEAAFEHGGSVAEGSLDRLPCPHPRMGERYGPRAGDPLAGGPSVAQVVGEAVVEDQDDDVAEFVEVPREMDFMLVKDEDAPAGLRRSPEQDGEDEIDGIAEESLAKGRERQAFEFVQTCGLGGVKMAGGVARSLRRSESRFLIHIQGTGAV